MTKPKPVKTAAPVQASAPPLMVRVRTVVAHEGHYAGEEDTVVLTPRIQNMINRGVFDLLGPAALPAPPVVTIIQPPGR